MLIKFFWVIRGILYNFVFGQFKFPSYIGKPIFIKNMKGIFIGRKVRIFPGARMEVHGDASKIIINDNTSIGQNFHIISALGEKLEIGKNTTISANVFITNTDHNYQDLGIPILDQELIAKKTYIGENCFIGYGAVIQAGTILGKQCIIGSNSVVRGNFSDYCVLAGAPAIVIKRYDLETKKWKKTNNKGEFLDEI